MSQTTENDGIWHELKWDETRIKRFWDFSACWEPWQNDYFSKQVGLGIVNFIKDLVPTQGQVLDFGCGPGYLVDHLLRSGISCAAVDSSGESVNLANQRFSTNPLWKGAKILSNGKSPYEENAFDLVICLETIEHIMPEHMSQWLSELRRMIKPETGRLLITTPNAENLVQNSIYCAECGAVAHRYQHLSSFTRQSLARLLNQSGFQTILCDVTDFYRFQGPLFSKKFTHWSLADLYRWMRWQAAGLVDRVVPFSQPVGSRRLQLLLGTGPHLFWLGRKQL